MISWESFTWFDSPIVKQSKLLYAIPWSFHNGCLGDKQNTEWILQYFEVVNASAPLIGKRHPANQNEIVVKK